MRFELLDGVRHAISERHRGVSPSPFASLNMGVSTGDSQHNVVANRCAFAESLGLSLADVISARISHGNEVTVFSQSRAERPGRRHPASDSSPPLPVFESDGVVSDVPGLHFMVTFADCVPLLFADRRTGVIGAAHAGWRGTALGVGPAVVASMKATFGSNPEDIAVGIGPSIGPCCYRVGSDVPEEFERQGRQPVMSKDGRSLDLWASNERQLRQSGIPGDQIENMRLCTSCNVTRFFSHRAERGRTGRFALCIGLPPSG